jgi:hypothetical protein
VAATAIASTGRVLRSGHRLDAPEHSEATTSIAGLLETAIWGAELATALTGSHGRGRVYVVEPTGPFEDDPNATNKRFTGNVTRSYRTRHPMVIVDEVQDWEGHPPDVVQGMLENISRLRAQGLDVVEDEHGSRLDR